MKRLISILTQHKQQAVCCLAFAFALSATAQTTIVQGRLLDNERNELIAASVRCYLNDTVFVKGVKTNTKGEFELKVPASRQAYQLSFSYLGYKELRLKINPSKEKNIRLGDVMLSKNIAQLQEVTVLGENRVQTEDKIMMYPTKEQLRYTYDGYSAIDVLMLPGLRLDPLTQKPTYMDQGIMLCINGREATESEIKDLDSKYILRVDLYSNGHPDYPEADYLLDFIMRERDYAGVTKANVTHQLNAPIGNTGITTQYFQNQSEFAVSAAGNYDRFHYRGENSTIETLRFPHETITNTEEDLPSTNPENNFNTYINYIYRDKKQDFYSSLRFNRDDRASDYWCNHSYSNETERLTKHVRANVKNINPALQLRYKRQLPNNQQFRVELYGSYGNNYYDNFQTYSTDNDVVTSTYNRIVNEQSGYVRAKGNYTKTFTNKSSLNIDIDQDYTHTNDQNLKQETPYEISMDRSKTKIFMTFNYRIQKRLSLRVQAASTLTHTRTNDDSDFEAKFIPSLKLSYLYKKHSLQVHATVVNTEPALSSRTNNEYQRDQYFYVIGNTDLKDYLAYNLNINYSWNINSRLTLMAHGGILYRDHPIYRNIDYDASRQALTIQSQNGSTDINPYCSLGVQYILVPQKLTLGISQRFEFEQMRLWQKLSYNQFITNGYVTFLHKGWKVSASMRTRYKSIDNASGTTRWHPFYFNINTSYNFNNLFIGLSMGAPFIKTRTLKYLSTPNYSQTTAFTAPRIMDNVFNLTLNYRFTFGKKKHKFDNTEVNDVNQSTIMQ